MIKVRIISQGRFCGAIFVRPAATVSTQVSIMNAEHSYYYLLVTVYHNDLGQLTSLSLNSQKPFHPKFGAYLNLSCTTACKNDKSRYNLVRSTGVLEALLDNEVMESFIFARTPAGCSYIKTREALNKLTGIFGLDSIDKKSRKSECGLRESIRFSRLCSQVGAK